MVKIAVDCRMLNLSGIGVYLENRLSDWIQNSDIEWILIGDKELLCKYEAENCTISHCVIPTFSYTELFRFPVDVLNQCSAFYTPTFSVPGRIKIPVFCTIHDVVFLDFKDVTNYFGRMIRKLLIYRAILKSQTVFTISQFSKERLIKHFKHPCKYKIAYSSLSANIDQYKDSEQKKVFDFVYILYVGNIKVHKGLDLLLEAHNKCRLKGSELKLVIVGSADNFKSHDSSIKKHLSKRNESIVFTGYVDTLTLYSIIANAKALIQPSRYEGFGLPPLEALYFGKTPIISDIPVFKEIYSDLPVTYFKDNDSTDLADKILNLNNINIPIESIRQKINEKYNHITTSNILLEEMKNYIFNIRKS